MIDLFVQALRWHQFVESLLCGVSFVVPSCRIQKSLRKHARKLQSALQPPVQFRNLFLHASAVGKGHQELLFEISHLPEGSYTRHLASCQCCFACFMLQDLYDFDDADLSEFRCTVVYFASNCSEADLDLFLQLVIIEQDGKRTLRYSVHASAGVPYKLFS